jgi:hypothetical protein
MKLAANLSWSFFSLAVVFPITYRIQRAYARRDQALAMLADVKSLVRPPASSLLHLICCKGSQSAPCRPDAGRMTPS